MAGIRGIYNRDFLAFPGRAPGFDTTHRAAYGISNGYGFSGIALNGNFINLLSGKPGVIAGTVTGSIDGLFGPVCTFSASGSQITFPGQSTKTNTVVTMACIARGYTGNYAGIFLTGSNGNGWGIQNNSTSVWGIQTPSNNNISGPVISNGTPYFFAASGSYAAQNFVVVNLATGKILTTVSNTSTSSSQPNGTYWVGTQGNGLEWNAGVAAVMFAPSFMSLPALLQWAQRPWDFGYPSSAQTVLFSGLRRKSTQTQVYGTIVG